MPHWLHVTLMIVTPILAFIGGYFYGMAYQLKLQTVRISRAYSNNQPGYAWQKGEET